MRAPIKGRVGRRRAPFMEGALLERWLAQCSLTGSIVHDRARRKASHSAQEVPTAFVTIHAVCTIEQTPLMKPVKIEASAHGAFGSEDPSQQLSPSRSGAKQRC